ncbi:MAG: HPr family phosphocarrier protein [Pyrinomonadaceae bacterium]
MRQGNVKVVNHLGLHARAAAKLIRTAGRFSSTISLINRGIETAVDAKSILSVLTLGASFGTILSLEVGGDDEDAAFDEVTRIFSDGFGEL